MKIWLKLFHQEKSEGITLILKGKTIPKSHFIRVGGGNVKVVYKIVGRNECIFLPSAIDDENVWNTTIQKEKMLLDQLHALGLKAQQFEIVPIEIAESGNTSNTLNVLLTRDFESLCKEESSALYNHKGDQKITGEAPDFVAMKENFKDQSFVRTMFNKIIKEYAVAFTFSLPISILQYLDDSEHYLFELAKDPKEPPVVRYMFWDVVGDFGGVDLPMVPTLSALKSGAKDESSSHATGSPTRGLGNLANSVACAMYAMNNNKLCNNYTFVREVEADLERAINQDNFLAQALDHAKNKASEFLSQKLDRYNDYQIIGNSEFVSLMRSAISIAKVDLVARVFQLHPKTTGLLDEDIDKIMQCSKNYDNQAVITYLNANLVSPSLKKKFFKKYDERLLVDQRAWFGIYSFFAKRDVNEGMSLEELVLQAQGLSKQSCDQRSLAVMKEMGWLNEKKELSSELNRVITGSK